MPIYDPDETEEKKKKRLAPAVLSNDTSIAPSQDPIVNVKLPGPGGFVQADNNRIDVAPDGAVTSNFVNPDEVTIAPVPVTPLPPMPVKQYERPAEPEITALTTNAQLTAAAEKAMGWGDFDLNTDQAAARKLAAQSREPGKRGQEARDKLTNMKVTASSGYLLGESERMAHLKETLATPAVAERIKKADFDRAYSILSNQREEKYADEVRQIEIATKQAELGIKKAMVDAAPTIEAERKADVKLKEAAIDNLPNAEKDAAIKRLKEEQELEALRRTNKIVAGAFGEITGPTKSTEQVASDIEAAKEPKDIQATFNEIQDTLLTHGADTRVIFDVALTALNASYRSPVELAAENGAPYTPLYTVNNENVKKVQADAEEALGRLRPSDAAVEEILAKYPEKAKDEQFIRDVSMAVWDTYNKAGVTALQRAKDYIAQSKVKAVSNLLTQLPAPETLTPQSIIAAKQDALSKARLEANAIAVSDPRLKPILEQKAQERLGGFKNIDGMTDTEIKLALLTQMGLKNTGNPAMLSLISETAKRIETGADIDKIHPELMRYLNTYVAQYAPVAAKAAQEQKAEREKEQAKKTAKYDKDKKYADENGFVVEHDPLTDDPVYFTTAAGAEAYRREPSKEGKQRLATEAENLTKARLADPRYRRFIKLDDSKKSVVRETIDQAKMLYDLYEGDIPEEALKPFEQLGVQESGVGTVKPGETRVVDLPAAINAYSMSYGLGPVFREKTETEMPGDWEVIPDKEILPFLTVEEALKAPPGTRFRDNEGNPRYVPLKPNPATEPAQAGAPKEGQGGQEPEAIATEEGPVQPRKFDEDGIPVFTDDDALTNLQAKGIDAWKTVIVTTTEAFAPPEIRNIITAIRGANKAHELLKGAAKWMTPKIKRGLQDILEREKIRMREEWMRENAGHQQ